MLKSVYLIRIQIPGCVEGIVFEILHKILSFLFKYQLLIKQQKLT